MLRPWEELDAYATEVRVAVGDQRYRRGSGYVIGPYRILTALHVLIGPQAVHDGARVEVPGPIHIRAHGDFTARFGRIGDVVVRRAFDKVRDAAAGDYLWRRAQLLWPQPGSAMPPFELAILDVAPDDALGHVRNAPRIKSLVPTGDLDCRATGFAQWMLLQTADGVDLSNPGTVTGVLTYGATRYRSYHAFTPTNGTPRNEEEWMGLSGSSFFDDETRQLVGLASEARRDVEPNGLWLTRLADLEGPDFAPFWAASGLSVPRKAYAARNPQVFDCPLEAADYAFDPSGKHPYSPLLLLPLRAETGDRHLHSLNLLAQDSCRDLASRPLVVVADTRPDLLDTLHGLLLSDPAWTPEDFVEAQWLRISRCSAEDVLPLLNNVTSASSRWSIFDFSDFPFEAPLLTAVWAAFEAGLRSNSELRGVVVGLPRWLATYSIIADWLRLQGAVFKMAGRYSKDYAFRVQGLSDLPNDTYCHDAILSLAHANSNALPITIGQGVKALSIEKGLQREEWLSRLAEYLFVRGFTEEALRLEKFAMISQISGHLITLAADVEPIVDSAHRAPETGEERLWGLIDKAQDAPRVGRRVVLTGEAGSGKSTTLQQMELQWILPHLHVNSPTWFPILLRASSFPEDLTTKLRREFASSVQGSNDRFARAPFVAHISLGRQLTPLSLAAVLSTPIAFLVDGLTEKTHSVALSWLREINALSADTCVVIAARRTEIAAFGGRDTGWEEIGPSGRAVRLSLRQLNVAQLRELCAHHHVDSSYSDAIAGPDLGPVRALRNPYLCTRFLSVVQAGNALTRHDTYSIVSAYVTQLTESDEELLPVAYESLPSCAYQNKVGGRPDVPKRVHDAARAAELLDPLSTPEAPRFAHRLLEDFFAAVFVIDQLRAGERAVQLLRGHERLWSSRWEYVLRMIIPQLEDPPRSAILELIAGRDLRLANRCIMELGPVTDVNAADFSAVSVRLTERIASGVNSARFEEALSDGLALGFLDPRLNHLGVFPHTVDVTNGETGPCTKIGQYPVTNLEFAKFVQAGGYDRREFWKSDTAWVWRTDIRCPRYWNEESLNRANAPVVGINFFEAQAYCEWLTSEADCLSQNLAYFVPSSREWDLAAGVVDDQLLSTIQDVLSRIARRSDQTQLVAAEGALAPLMAQIAVAMARFEPVLTLNRRMRGDAVPRPIGMFSPSGRGCFDMIGHIWEWCVWAPSDVDPTNWQPVVKGGPLWHPEALFTAVIGGMFDPYTRFHQVGFRVGAIERGR